MTERLNDWLIGGFGWVAFGLIMACAPAEQSAGMSMGPGNSTAGAGGTTAEGFPDAGDGGANVPGVAPMLLDGDTPIEEAGEEDAGVEKDALLVEDMAAPMPDAIPVSGDSGSADDTSGTEPKEDETTSADSSATVIPEKCLDDVDCDEGEVCNGGMCECASPCGDVQCGVNGCGESCGQCELGEVCSSGGVCEKDCAACPSEPSCLNRDFETGDLSGWKHNGVDVVSEYDGDLAPQGSYMLKLDSAVSLYGEEEGEAAVQESGKAMFTACLPSTHQELQFMWRAYSEEFLEWCGGNFQDSFEVSHQLPDGSWSTIFEVFIDDLCPPDNCEGCGSHYSGLTLTDVTLDQGDVYATPWMTSKVGLGQWDVEQVETFRFRAKSAVDFLYETVILIDDVVIQPCSPDCDGKSCGSDGCGGQCGMCPESETCVDGGNCCLPNCDGKTCGTDGCGGTCGECSGTNNCVAGSCVGTCGNGSCQMNKGEHCLNCPEDCTEPDQCPLPDCPLGTVLNCDGECVLGMWLGDGYCDSMFKCEESDWDKGDCIACEPDCDGKVCGSDGCDGSCGECEEGSLCANDGTCHACEPQCADKECGADGCGGSCGECDDNFVCGLNGMCGEAGCTASPNKGCQDCPCEQCVCDMDSFCCGVMWDAVCVYECIDSCGGCALSDADSMDGE